MALNAAISGSILAEPEACLVMMMMMMALPFGSTRALPPRRLPTFPLDSLAAPVLLRSAVDNGEIPVAREQRKLAAILAADVVCYSRLMGRDESGTLARLRDHRMK
jgi:class 3 adenylate cyclase